MIQTRCACCRENDQATLLRRIADFARENNGEESLIQVLHMAQSVYGHLPLEVQETVAEAMNIPLAKVSGVVSFYSFFTPNPRGRHTIRVCLGTACYVRGGKKIVESLGEKLGVKIGETTADGLFTLEVARCIGACGLAPAMAIDDVVYKQVAPGKLEQILERYQNEEALTTPGTIPSGRSTSPNCRKLVFLPSRCALPFAIADQAGGH